MVVSKYPSSAMVHQPRLLTQTSMVMSNIYDVRNRMTSSTDGNEITTGYAYDDNNNLITLTDGNGEDRQWFYDERNLATLQQQGMISTPRLMIRQKRLDKQLLDVMSGLRNSILSEL